MGIYPELEKLRLEALIERFQSQPLEGKEYASGYYMEIAERICEYGEEGVGFLKQQLSNPNVARVRAVLFALSVKKLRPDTLPVLMSALNDRRPLVVAEDIDGLRHNGYQEAMEQIVLLISHPSPYVAGAALRFVSAFDRDQAIPLLLNTLKHPHFVLRENACDELGNLEVIEAIPDLTRLLNDPHPYVRQAAQTALEELRSAQKEKSEVKHETPAASDQVSG